MLYTKSLAKIATSYILDNAHIDARQSQHIREIQNASKTNGISVHSIKTGHVPDWDKVKFLRAKKKGILKT